MKNHWALPRGGRWDFYFQKPVIHEFPVCAMPDVLTDFLWFPNGVFESDIFFAGSICFLLLD